MRLLGDTVVVAEYFEITSLLKTARTGKRLNVRFSRFFTQLCKVYFNASESKV